MLSQRSPYEEANLVETVVARFLIEALQQGRLLKVQLLCPRVAFDSYPERASLKTQRACHACDGFPHEGVPRLQGKASAYRPLQPQLA
jgi:hypothetical protein